MVHHPAEVRMHATFSCCCCHHHCAGAIKYLTIVSILFAGMRNANTACAATAVYLNVAHVVVCAMLA
jgi:hypothetical protein